MKKISSLALILAAFALPMKSAQAIVATCPDPTLGGVGVISIDTVEASSCHSYGENNVDLSPLVLLDKTADGDDLFEGALTMIESTPDSGLGTFSIGDVGDYINLVLVVKSGNLDGLQWGAFNLGSLDGIFTLQDSGGNFMGLSGGELWGSLSSVPPPPMSAVPLPATFWLFGTALLGFAGLARRTKI